MKTEDDVFAIGAVVALASHPEVPLTINAVQDDCGGPRAELTYFDAEGRLRRVKDINLKALVPYTRPYGVPLPPED